MSRSIRTLMLTLSVDDFEEIAAAIDSGEFYYDDTFAEVQPEDRDDVFDSTEYEAQV